MRRLPLLLALALLFAAAAGPASAAQTWHSQQPLGVAGYPALLGAVGDVEFQAPNRGMLITAGNGGVAPGLFAYDGSGWYRYATVCGGEEGRIAWAGPDEFWTISDQQPGQATGKAPAKHISLCHFKDGQVVASYAEPIGVANSYLPMNAAACAGPSDCWFAGDRLLPPNAVNQGAFHLHWDGGGLSAIPSLTAPTELADPGRSVFGLAYHQGSFYESARVQEDDQPSREEEEKEAELGPSFLHRLQPGSATPFQPLFGAAPFEYGSPGAEAAELQGFHLSDEGQRLWAVSGASGAAAGVTVLRLDDEGLTQLPLEDPGAVLGPGFSVRGAAAEPGLDRVWVSFRRESDGSLVSTPARLTRIEGDGTVGAEVTLPAAGEEVGGEALGNKGAAGPVACAGPEQCWMATRLGWLFHLGTDPAPNGDPALHVLITSRPPDDSLPVLPPLELPEDDSGAGSKKGTSDQEAAPGEFDRLPKRKPALLAKIKQRLLDGEILELSFTLRAKAHVRLVARRQGRVVAQTRRYTMARGRRSLRLRLDPKRWPTKLDLQAHPVKSGASK